jgi:hypothetical protein
MGLQVIAASAVVILAPVGIPVLIGVTNFMALFYSSYAAVFKS